MVDELSRETPPLVGCVSYYRWGRGQRFLGGEQQGKFAFLYEERRRKQAPLWIACRVW